MGSQIYELTEWPGDDKVAATVLASTRCTDYHGGTRCTNPVAGWLAPPDDRFPFAPGALCEGCGARFVEETVRDLCEAWRFLPGTRWRGPNSEANTVLVLLKWRIAVDIHVTPYSPPADAP